MAKILIIDDEHHVRRVYEKFLSRTGHDVLLACDGHEGLDLYHKHDIDLVITDLIMPNMEGLEMIKLMRKHNPTQKIITISGGGSNPSISYLQMAEMLGSCEVLWKPVERDQFLSVVEKHLS